MKGKSMPKRLMGELTISLVNRDMRYIKSMMPDLKKAIKDGDVETVWEICNEVSGIGGNWATYAEEFANSKKGN
jgi:hypothetical protein